MGFTNKNDGEFWISVNDFKRQFSKIEICHISPDPIDSDIKWYGEPWRKSLFTGFWTPGQSAGGCANHSKLMQKCKNLIFISGLNKH